MMKDFKHDLITLMHAVRERPAIWNKYHESYKDRTERHRAWEQVMTVLDEDYDNYSREDKCNFLDTVISKWTNLRDTYSRKLRLSAAQKSVRPYIYAEHLSFLKQVLPHAGDRQVASTSENTGDEDNNDEARYFEGPNSPEPMLKRSKKRKLKYEKSYETRERIVSDQSEDEMPEQPTFLEVQTNPEPRQVMNEDEAFFASLLPTVATYSLEERLEFRVEVLATMKRINDNRKRNTSTDDF